MLLGKQFSMCMRALRMVAEVILIPTIDDLVQCNDTFMANLEATALEQDMQALVRLSCHAGFADDGIIM